MTRSEEPRRALREIENQLDAGSYRPGPWKLLVESLRSAPRETRRDLAGDISRVSEKLHQRRGLRTLSLRAGLALEIGATAAALLVLDAALEHGWVLALLVATGLLTMTLQPLLKMSVGTLLGVRYAYFYIWGSEPRVKMRYGTFLAAKTWQRVMLHLAGTLGSPLALGLCSAAIAPAHPRVSLLIQAALGLLVVFQITLLGAGIADAHRVGPSPPLALSSAGAAGLEIRSALRRRGG